MNPWGRISYTIGFSLVVYKLMSSCPIHMLQLDRGGEGSLHLFLLISLRTVNMLEVAMSTLELETGCCLLLEGFHIH